MEVSASAAMLATENATVGTVIENRRIVELPLNGRNFLQLVALSPNVTYGFGTPGQAGGRQGGDRASQNISLMGMRGTWNRYTLDGVENTDVNFNLYVVLPSIDALQEFKVQSGIYPAEFGRAASQINVSTKPGDNAFHGSMFEFLRNDKLDAKQYDFIGTSPTKSPFKYNQYGFTLGGPVMHPEDLQRQGQAVLHVQLRGLPAADAAAMASTPRRPRPCATAISPTRCQATSCTIRRRKSFVNGVLTGTPFPNNQIPKSRFDPTSLKLLEFWPAPNVTTSRVQQQLPGRHARHDRQRPVHDPLDFNESPTSQWFGRYSRTDETVLNKGWAQNGTTLYTSAWQAMLSNTRVFGVKQSERIPFRRESLLQPGGPGAQQPARRGEGVGHSRAEHARSDHLGHPAHHQPGRRQRIRQRFERTLRYLRFSVPVDRQLLLDQGQAFAAVRRRSAARPLQPERQRVRARLVRIQRNIHQ